MRTVPVIGGGGMCFLLFPWEPPQAVRVSKKISEDINLNIAYIIPCFFQNAPLS
jgi:hypothetical protein